MLESNIINTRDLTEAVYKDNKYFEETLKWVNEHYGDALRRLATNDFLDKVELNDEPLQLSYYKSKR